MKPFSTMINTGGSFSINYVPKILSATCASVIALGVGSAIAADLYKGGGLKDGTPAYVPPPLWTGFYIGVNGGGSFGASNNLTVLNNGDTSQADIGQFFRDGGFGGGQIGYNFQGWGFGPRFLFGVEADIQGAGINDSFTRADLNYSFAPATFNANQQIDFFGTVRGRVGYTFDQALIYGTGGFAYANVKTSVAINGLAGGGFNNFLSADQIETGWTAGGGVEYLFAPAWSVKVEYLYVDLGKQTISAIASDGVIDRFDVDNNFHTVKAGVNYHIPVGYTPLK